MLLGVFLISLVSSSPGTYKQDSDINLIQICDNCTFVNITSVLFPNGSVAVSNVEMTKDGTYYNFTLDSNFTNTIGEYTVTGLGDLDGDNTIWTYNFIITTTGFLLTESISMIYFILMFGVFGVFLLTLWGAIVLPMKNPRGGLDEIVDVSILKYFKLSLMFLSYALFMWLINLLLTLSNNFIILSQYLGFFTMTFVILRSFIWPLFVIMWVTFTFLAWKDLQLIKFLERGLNPK